LCFTNFHFWHCHSLRDEAINSYGQIIRNLFTILASNVLDNQILLEKWTQTYDGGKRFGHMTTNLKGARSLPVCALVKTTFKRTKYWFKILVHWMRHKGGKHITSRLSICETFYCPDIQKRTTINYVHCVNKSSILTKIPQLRHSSIFSYITLPFSLYTITHAIHTLTHIQRHLTLLPEDSCIE